MNTIHLHSTSDEDDPDSVSFQMDIKIDLPMLGGNNAEIHGRDARRLVHALLEYLPNGTLDEVVKLLKQKGYWSRTGSAMEG